MAGDESLNELIQEIVEFRDQSDWQQFHTFRNLTTALSVEASELLELTQWLKDYQVEIRN